MGAHQRFEAILNVPYGSAGGRTLRLDVKLPNAPFQAPFPAVVFFHGGGWYSGDKRGVINATYMDALPRRGYAVVSVEYRLAPRVLLGDRDVSVALKRSPGTALFPAQIDDVRQAFEYIKTSGHTLGLDTDRVAVAGFSAGAHLAALYAASARDGQLRPRAAIVLSGPTDFLNNPRATDPKQNPHLDEGHFCAEHCLLGGEVDQNREAAELANPLQYVSATTPPFLIVHGCDDPIVPVTQAESLYAALNDVGAQPTLVRVAGGDHGFWDAGHDYDKEPDFPPGVDQYMVRFLDRHVLGKSVDLPGPGLQSVHVADLCAFLQRTI